MRTKEEILKNEDERTFLTSCFFSFEKWYERVLGRNIKPYHREWIQILKNNKRIAISAFTGSGKTSLFGVGFCLWMAYFHPKSISLIVANTIRTQSSKILEEIKWEIENNEILKQLIPLDSRTTWTKEKLITSNGSIIQYSANSPNIRGIQADYLFADEVATYDDHEVFFRDVASRVNSKDGILAAVSTPIHTADLLAKLMNSKNYFKKFYPAIINSEGIGDINGESAWSERFSKERLLKIRDTDGLSNFEKNYMCNPRAEAEDPVFTLSSVEDCYDVSRSFTTESEGGQVYIGADFAISSGPTADFDAFTVVEYVGEKAIIRHGERHRGMPIPSKVQRLRELFHVYKPIRMVLDPSNIGSAIVQQLRNEGMPIETQSFQSQARRKLLIDLRVLIDNKQLIIPRNLDNPTTIIYIDKLTEELIGFRDIKSKVTETKHLVSTSAHDDTAISLAMACKGSSILCQSFEDHIASG